MDGAAGDRLTMPSRGEALGLAALAIGGVTFVFGVLLVYQRPTELIHAALLVGGAITIIVSAGFLLVLYKTIEITGRIP